ncbi:DUF1682 domain-containing protein [Histoplasma capsulatum var. duboisii H88]|uniref:DUF1682 domain-containing protein n=1 Tax=Ajellomyces capsulatus (strain H88) TaxID=544711 RepID=A0A8A1LJK6_AJEC8|nr:DUF1682 domain-containing protein [Histoplasma capsulatum var. duboisii H88]
MVPRLGTPFAARLRARSICDPLHRLPAPAARMGNGQEPTQSQEMGAGASAHPAERVCRRRLWRRGCAPGTVGGQRASGRVAGGSCIGRPCRAGVGAEGEDWHGVRDVCDRQAECGVPGCLDQVVPVV